MKTLLILILSVFVFYLIFASYRDMKQAVESKKIHDKYKMDKFWTSQRDFEE